MSSHTGVTAPRGASGRFGRVAVLALLALVLPQPFAPAPQAGPDDGVWSPIAPGTPSPRKWPGVVYDPVRQRLIVMGGLPGPLRDVWVQPLTGPPAWSRLQPAGIGPSARYAHSLIYQPGQDRVILFGGYDTAFRNDVWALSLSGTPTWTRLAPAGTSPSPRWANVAVYDAARDRMIIFGGHNGITSLGDAWALTLGATPTWTQLTPAGPLPQPRTNVTGVYDGVRDQVIVFGGFNTGTQQFLGDVWALSLSGTPAWTQLLPAGTAPSPRRDHSMIYDVARGRVVVFGGGDSAPRGDAFALTLGPSPAWSQLAPAGPAPSPRQAHRAIYDGARDRMWIFGGDDGQYSSHYLDDTWGLPLGAGSAWEPLGDAPVFATSPRRNYGMACAGGSVVVFGGDGGSLRDDTGLLRLTPTPAWEPALPAVRPTARFGHHMIFDPPRNRVLLFGGYDGAYLNDVQAFSMETGQWQAIATSGTPPGGRMYYGLVYDPVRERMLVIGGHPDFLNDVWALSLNGPPEWTQLSPSGSRPSPRYAHSLIYQPGRDRVILFGGYDGRYYLSDVWALSLSGAPAWTQIASAGAKPSGRWASAVAYDPVRDRLVVFGGWDGSQARNDAWALTLGATPAWTQLAPGGPLPEPRANIEGVYDPAGDRLIMMAGFDPGTHRFFEDTWALTWGTPPTPALVSLVLARAEPGRASIQWQVSDGQGAIFTVQRRGAATAWSDVCERAPDGEQRVTFDDRDVVEGARYGYRLAIAEGGAATHAGEVWLDIPRAARLALAGARPNPAGRVLTIGYTLEDAGPATLELFDTSGRRLFAREVGAEGAGEHELRVAGAGAWSAGIYFARLRQHGRALTSRVIVIR